MYAGNNKKTMRTIKRDFHPSVFTMQYSGAQVFKKENIIATCVKVKKCCGTSRISHILSIERFQQTWVWFRSIDKYLTVQNKAQNSYKMLQRNHSKKFKLAIFISNKFYLQKIIGDKSSVRTLDVLLSTLVQNPAAYKIILRAKQNLKVNLHSIRFSFCFRPFFYVFASWKSMRFFIRIFISPYPH